MSNAEEDLGFGDKEACQAAIGITCEECRYHDVCVGDNARMDKIAEDKFLKELVEL